MSNLSGRVIVMKREKMILFAACLFASVFTVLLLNFNTNAQTVPTPTPTPKVNIGGGGPGIGGDKIGTPITFNPPINKGPFIWQEMRHQNMFLSIDMPTNFDVASDKTEFALDSWGSIRVMEWTTTGGYINDAVFMFEVYKTKKAKDVMYELAKHHFRTFTTLNEELKCYELKNNDTQGIQCKSKMTSFTLKRGTSLIKKMYLSLCLHQKTRTIKSLNIS